MTTLARREEVFKFLRYPYALFIVVWVLAMISVPIAKWTWSDTIIPLASVLTTILQFAAVAAILQYHWGIRRTVMVFALVALITYSAEFLGSKTDFPFGAYDYTASLQPQLFGVPLIIPLAWFMMLAPSWGIASAILGGNFSTPLRLTAFILISALAITAWDLYLDPQMVGWGFWQWEQPSGYFGIPWVNYFGWILTASIVTTVIRPRNIPVQPLLLIYTIVWMLQSIGLAVFWGQPGPALFGFLAMGSLLGFAVARIRKSSQKAI
jgi:putative membrane protein